jgi:hypothetical protein
MQQPDILPTDILGGADETGHDERERGRAALGRAGRAVRAGARLLYQVS